jgi:hypothetical protein
LADFSSVAGVVISLVGFGITVFGVFKSGKAATRAEAAANAARTEVHLHRMIADFSEAIGMLEEIKRLHRSGAWQILPDRYSALRKTLIVLRSSNQSLNDEQRAAVQNALVDVADIEARVEKTLENPLSLKPAKFNQVISADIDRLLSVLTQLMAHQSGGQK